jgi:hypothetical protein
VIRWHWILLPLLGVLSTGCGEKRIILSRAKLQELVSRNFPLEKNAIVAHVRIEKPEVYFSDAKIGIKVQYAAGLLDKHVDGFADFAGQIKYVPAEGAFYLMALVIRDIAVHNTSFAGDETLKRAIAGVLQSFLGAHPVYTLQPKNFNQKLTRLLLKDVAVAGDQLVLTLGAGEG